MTGLGIRLVATHASSKNSKRLHKAAGAEVTHACTSARMHSVLDARAHVTPLLKATQAINRPISVYTDPRASVRGKPTQIALLFWGGLRTLRE